MIYCEANPACHDTSGEPHKNKQTGRRTCCACRSVVDMVRHPVSHPYLSETPAQPTYPVTTFRHGTCVPGFCSSRVSSGSDVWQGLSRCCRVICRSSEVGGDQPGIAKGVDSVRRRCDAARQSQGVGRCRAEDDRAGALDIQADKRVDRSRDRDYYTTSSELSGTDRKR
jgi:hypothetical protein